MTRKPCFFKRWLDAVRIRESATSAEGIEAAQHGVAAAQNEHSIDALERELECGLNEVVPVAVHYSVGAEPPRQRRPISAGRHGQDFCAAFLGKLDGQRSNGARRAMNHDVLARLDIQMVRDSLERCEAGGRHGACVFEVKRWLRKRCDQLGGHHNVLRIKSTLGIIPTIGINLVAHFEAAYPRTQLSNCARAIRPEDQGKTNASTRIPSFANVRFPPPTPAVCTAIKTSFGPSSGTGNSSSVSTSGPPYRSIAMARIVFGTGYRVAATEPTRRVCADLAFRIRDVCIAFS